nr:glycosyltransferase family 4 protein [Nocardiopsis mwathae]
MRHVPDTPGTPILLLAENIEYALDRARQEVVGAEPVAWTRTREVEQAAWRRADLCGTVSVDDAAVLRHDLPTARIRWLPSGCDHISADDPLAAESAGLVPPTPRGRTVTYVGNSTWGPSRDAALYLLGEVWPQVLAEVPDARLLVAGSGQDPDGLGLTAVDPSVHLLGVVPSLAPVLAATDVFVCPNRFGGGVKAKILEALHAGCAVVSTSFGAQGVGPVVQEALLTGDSTDELVFGIVRLLRDGTLLDKQRSLVRDAIHTLPTWDEATDRMHRAWTEMRTPAAG